MSNWDFLRLMDYLLAVPTAMKMECRLASKKGKEDGVFDGVDEGDFDGLDEMLGRELGSSVSGPNIDSANPETV